MNKANAKLIPSLFIGLFFFIQFIWLKRYCSLWKFNEHIIILNKFFILFENSINFKLIYLSLN